MKIPVFNFFEKVNEGQLKMANVNLKKWPDLTKDLTDLKIMKEPGTSFQSPAFSQKHIRNVCHTAH